MRNARDSFVHYLADNLPHTVHVLRADSSAPAASRLTMNAINVDFIDVSPSFGNATMRVVLDVINDDENTALDMIESIWNLFKQSFYTPVRDFTIHNTPELKARVFWDTNGTRFVRVATDRYCHYSCTITLRYAQD